MARSILWAPASGGPRPGDIPFPVFLAQSALTAISEHVAGSARPGQGILGFLLGDLCECPETNVSYLVVDAALRLNQVIYGDRTRDLITRLWDKIQAQLEEQRAHLIGWYHTHPPLPLALSPDDVETHEHYFAEPWQVALLLGTDPAEPAGAFFRVGSDAWAGTPLPFYELLKEESIRPGGKKRSFVTWKNYRAYNPVAHVPAPTEPKFTRASAQPEPEPELEPEPEVPPEPQPPPPRPAREERTSELKFLTTAEDFAAPPSPRTAPPSRPRPAPPPRQRAAPPPAPVEQDVTPEPEWPAEFEEQAEAVQEEAVEEAPPPPAPRAPRRRKRRRGLWRMLFALVIVGGAGGAYWWFRPQLPPLKIPQAVKDLPSQLVARVKALPVFQRRAAPSRPAPARPAPAPARPQPAAAQRAPAAAPAAAPAPPPAAAPPPASPYAKLDQVGDSLTLVVRNFNDRAALFDRNQLACAGLARGLVTVEQRWIAYNTARRVAGVLDAAHAARDQTLYAGVDSVERRFERSGCERP